MAPDTMSSAGKLESSKKLFIGGLSWGTTEDTLRSHFEEFGEVSEVRIMFDRGTGKPRGFGFVVFGDGASAETAAEKTHTIDGRQVEAKKAVPKDSENQRQDGVSSSNSVGSNRGNVANSTTGNGGSLSNSPSVSNARVVQPPMNNVPAIKCKKIFVGGLAPSTREDEFRSYFEQFGPIGDAVVMYDHATQRPRGFGFVTYETEEAVDEVFKLGAIHTLGDKKVECKRAVPKEHMPPGSSNMRGNRPGRTGTSNVGSGGLGNNGGSSGNDGSMFTSSPYGNNYAALERSMGALSFGPGNGAVAAGFHGTGGYAGAVGQQMAGMGAYPGTFAAAAAYGAHYPTGGMMASPVGYGMSAAASAGYAGVGFPDGYNTGTTGYGTSLYAATGQSGLEAGGPMTMQYTGHDGGQGITMTMNPAMAQYGIQTHTQQSNSGSSQGLLNKQSYDVKQAQQDPGDTESNKDVNSQVQEQQIDVGKHESESLARDQTQSVSYSSALASGGQHQQQTKSLQLNSPNSFGVSGEYRPYFPYM